jgi:hypothetical protein
VSLLSELAIPHYSLCFFVTCSSFIARLLILTPEIVASAAQPHTLTALHEACCYGSVDAVLFLIEHSADVNVLFDGSDRDELYDATPLMFALSY